MAEDTNDNTPAPDKPAIVLPVATADNIGKYIGQYVALRNKIKAIEKLHKEQLEPFKDMLVALNGVLMNHLNSTGMDSSSVRGAGTVYKSVKKSASIADGEAFKRHVIGTQDFDLLDWKANSTAVEEFIKEHGGELPPGVKYNTMVTVNVRAD